MRLVHNLTILILLPVVALAQEFEGHTGHDVYHDSAYSHWNIPGSVVSCCHARHDNNGEITGDCYPTEFRLGKNGWEALLDPRTNGGKHVFVALPEDRQLHEKNPDPSGVTGHLCENYSHDILCWVPPTGLL